MNKTPDATEVVIVAAARTPFGKLMGSLAKYSATDLGGVAIKGALEQAGIAGDSVDAVILGQVLQAGVGQNPAKQAALAGGVRQEAHTTTVNKVCLSGLSAIIDAARMIRLGEAQVVVAGGMESMSQAPHLLPQSRRGTKYGNATLIDHMAYDGLSAAGSAQSMGALTEEFAATYPASREEQDHSALLSHQRAAAAQLEDELLTLPELDHDEGVRPQLTAEQLAGLRPAFAKEGTLTAGNSSQISDGAAVCVLSSKEQAVANGWPILATVRSCGQIAGPDHSLQEKPAQAIEQALAREGWTVADLDLVEINEAFAAVTVASAKRLGIEGDKVNIDGGAVAVGHPIGASGARLAGHMAHAVAQGRAKRVAIGLCGGGGQGEALLLERA